MPQNSRTITQKICIRGAKGLEMIFAADSVVRRGDNSVAFYANAECSELVAEHFSENNEDLRRMPPVLVRGDACWVKVRQEGEACVRFRAFIYFIAGFGEFWQFLRVSVVLESFGSLNYAISFHFFCFWWWFLLIFKLFSDIFFIDFFCIFFIKSSSIFIAFFGDLCCF